MKGRFCLSLGFIPLVIKSQSILSYDYSEFFFYLRFDTNWIHRSSSVSFYFLLLVIFFFFSAAPAAYGSSWFRNHICATEATWVTAVTTPAEPPGNSSYWHFFLMATPWGEYGSSQARDTILAAAVAMLNPLAPCTGLGIELVPLQQPELL